MRWQDFVQREENRGEFGLLLSRFCPSAHTLWGHRGLDSAGPLPLPAALRKPVPQSSGSNLTVDGGGRAHQWTPDFQMHQCPGGEEPERRVAVRFLWLP